MDILREDHDIIVVYKEAGLATQSGRIGQKDLVSEVKKHLAGAGKAPYLGIIHRLDQPVEGLLVFAKTKEAAADLTAQLQNEGLGKFYYAVTCKRGAQEEGDLEDHLQKDPATGLQTVCRQGATSQRAALHYRLIAEEDGLFLYQIKLETGRFHQIRVQMAHAGMPLIGDQKYGGERAVQIARQKGIRTVALCAYALSFRHPKSGAPVTVEIRPKGAAFEAFARRMK